MLLYFVLFGLFWFVLVWFGLAGFCFVCCCQLSFFVFGNWLLLCHTSNNGSSNSSSISSSNNNMQHAKWHSQHMSNPTRPALRGTQPLPLPLSLFPTPSLPLFRYLPLLLLLNYVLFHLFLLLLNNSRCPVLFVAGHVTPSVEQCTCHKSLQTQEQQYKWR